MASEPISLTGSPQRAFGDLAQAHPVTVELVPWRTMAHDGAIAEWDALAQWASEPNPFHESWYLLPALEAFDPDETVGLLRIEAGGMLAGLVPLRREARYYRHRLPQWSNWTHANCFLGAPLIAHSLEKPVWRAILDWADSHAGKALFLHLAHLPLDGALYRMLREMLDEENRLAALVHSEERALLRSTLSPEAYLDSALAGKKRKELRRQHRRFEEEGELRIERQTGDEGIAQWCDAFLWLEASGWKGRNRSAMASDARTTNLFRKALEGAAARGRLERLALTLDGAPIAMLANFLTPPGSFAFKTTYDEKYARFSPGVLLQCENLQLLTHPELDWCDSCASPDHPMIDHFWRERRPIGRISIAIGGPVNRTLFRAIAWAETGRTPGALR